jgi:asparagine synthase (glutamine-hydrolysing)
VSVQFGRWSFDGLFPPVDYLEKTNALLTPFAPDRSSHYYKDGVSILYCAFHTTKESRRETQPHISRSGTVLTWDGRLDNRAELLHQLDDSLSIGSTDVSIVAAAHDRWGTDCFGKLVGDWALSIWNPNDRSLLLVKDPGGVRHLYYSVEQNQVTWCTILDPLVLFRGRTLALCEEYMAGWFSFFPAAHLTPYLGIHSVPPSFFVRVGISRQTTQKYWDFDRGRRIRYRTDAEYEEHFRAVFEASVLRRLRSDTPILAELSGGIDSSSIVCMADAIIARGATETPRLDTLSYYDDSEPNWNERPYFTQIEEKRGRAGCHIDVGVRESFRFESENKHFAATPASGDGRLTKASRQIAACMASQRNRVLLSGVGGDEVTGGVPTPRPELMDLMARAQFTALAHKLLVWALDRRKPWFHLFFEAVRGFLPSRLVGIPKHMRAAPWLQPSFIRRHPDALTGYQSRIRLFGPLPSFQENLSTIDALRRQLAFDALLSVPPHEKRYPYLDRDLLEFVCAVPREQLLRPGQRRSLMRRALAGIVPDAILQRRRKAFVSRTSLDGLTANWPNFVSEMVSGKIGLLDSQRFGEVIRDVRCGKEVSIVALMRTLSLEFWLRQLLDLGVISGYGIRGATGFLPHDA